MVSRHTLVNGGLCRAARRHGVAVLAWTVNETDRARELSLLEVAAIISDHPALICSAFLEGAS